MGTLVASSAKSATSIAPKPALSGVVYDPGRPSARRSPPPCCPWRPNRLPYTMARASCVDNSQCKNLVVKISPQHDHNFFVRKFSQRKMKDLRLFVAE